MAPIDFLEILRRRPFEKFRLQMVNGAVHEIHHPEMVALRVSVVWVHFPGRNGPLYLAERQVVVDLDNIVQVEFLEQSVPTKGNGSVAEPG